LTQLARDARKMCQGRKLSSIRRFYAGWMNGPCAIPPYERAGRKL
jgi:hypothetical protein